MIHLMDVCMTSLWYAELTLLACGTAFAVKPHSDRANKGTFKFDVYNFVKCK